MRQAHAQVKFNGDLENIDNVRKLPVGWTYPKTMQDTYNFTLDSIVKQHGKYAVAISDKGKEISYASMGFGIPQIFKGHQIELRGYLKTENVENNAGFWLRIDGTSAFENMHDQHVHGTTDWTAYSIKLPYDDEHAVNIAGGVILDGKGKVWFDNVQLLIDGKPIEEAEPKVIIPAKAELDTIFNKRSGIDHIAITPRHLKNLTILGQVWGFVKYHHFEVAKGNINMDAELFRVMPAVLKADNDAKLSNILEQWVNKLGVPAHCTTCKTYPYNNAKLTPDYGHIFDHSVLSVTLTDKLTDILNNRSSNNFYIKIVEGSGYPFFDHEKSYEKIKYPDAGYRLLCLFRFWNMIQYFYPDRHLTGDWNAVLPEFITKFINDTNAQHYVLTTQALICRIHDTHASVWNNAILEDYRGKYAPPFQAKFIEGKLVATAYFKDTPGVKSKIRIGDVITAINGVAVKQLIKKYLPITAGSNYATQLRDIPAYYLLRSNNRMFKFKILRSGRIVNVNMNAVNYYSINFDASNPNPIAPEYSLINKQIGYVYPARYHNTDLPAIKKLFEGTKGIIIDMRCYPSDSMPFTFVPFIKTGNAPFAKFTSGSIIAPGFFEVFPPLYIKPDSNGYKGKVVVIVNQDAQSKAEYTTMAFQSSKNVTVIGSTTAGADGIVSAIVLPGGIQTTISGLGVLYPDGTETQRVGVKIDKQVHPTIAGIKAGRDEPLEYAKKLILSN